MQVERIQLTEEQLHQMIDETVNNVLLSEGFWNNIWKGAAPIRRGVNNMGKNIGSAASNMANKAGNSMRQFGSKVSSTAQKVGQGVANTANNFGNAMKATGQEMRSQYQSGKLNDARDNAIKALQTYMAYAKQVYGVSDNTTRTIQNAINQITMNANGMSNLANGRARKQTQAAWQQFRHPSQFQQ